MSLSRLIKFAEEMDLSYLVRDREDGVAEVIEPGVFGLPKTYTIAGKTYISPPTLTSTRDGYIITPGRSQPAPTITMGCIQALKFKVWTLFSKSAGPPTEETGLLVVDDDELYRPRFSTAPTDWDEDDPRWGSFASESQLRGFSDCRLESLSE